MIGARILGSAGHLMGPAVATAEVAARAGLDPLRLRARTGIESRHWAPPGTSLASLGTAALQGALADADMGPAEIARVIFVSSTGGDRLIPATANLVADAIGANRTCDAFDLNNACTGFLTAFDLAARSVATGTGPVAIVVAERFAPYVGADDPRPYAVMGDAAAAVIVGPSQTGGMLASVLRNDGRHAPDIEMAHPMVSGAPARLHFHARNKTIGAAASDAIAEVAEQALAQAGVVAADIDALVSHQPNGPLLDLIVARLGVPPERLVRVVDTIGSVGAASAPYGLDTLRRSRPIRSGEKWLMVAVGAGMSYGALVYQEPSD